MAIEIKELHIRITVNASQSAAADGAAKPAAGTSGAAAGADADKDAIIAECVEQVLQILQNKQER